MNQTKTIDISESMEREIPVDFCYETSSDGYDSFVSEVCVKVKGEWKEIDYTKAAGWFQDLIQSKIWDDDRISLDSDWYLI